MRILVIEPLKPPYSKDICGSLEEMKAIVGGYIQAIYPFDDPIALVCNEEGKLIGCIYRAELATCTGKTCHLAGEFPPPRRRGLPVQKRDHIL